MYSGHRMHDVDPQCANPIKRISNLYFHDIC